MINSEILAPAGSIDTLYAAINAGADAVYIGGQRFGARAYAENPEDTDLLRAIDYVHFNNKKIYLTVNTLLKDNEIEEQLFSYLKPIYEQGLDAVIVQDLGVFNFIRNNFPNLDIHGSTQMAISGVESAQLLKNMGATRIVTARELSLNELHKIHENVNIEIESFIHGAMCYSYSGMCLFSSIIGGRSGNRGRCAGPCRQPYEVYMDKKRINNADSMYALSLRDMNTLEILPEILEAGVYSLKIEGRMKSPEYSAGVVSIYRKYVDLYNEYGSKSYKINAKDMQNLSELYSRSGSTTGYYKTHNSKKMISLNKPAYTTGNDTFVQEINNKYCSGKIKKAVNCKIVLEAGKPCNLTVFSNDTKVTVSGPVADIAQNRPIDKENVLKQLNKTGDTFIHFEDISVNMDKNIFVPLKQLNELRREAVSKFESIYLEDYRRKALDSQDNIKPINIENSSDINIICSISTEEQFNKVLNFHEINEIYICCDLLSAEKSAMLSRKAIESGKKPYIVLPYIYRINSDRYLKALFLLLKDIKEIRYVVRNIDELGLVINNNIKNFIIDSSLYAFNKRAYEFYKKNGALRVTLPYELNHKEMKKLAAPDSELIVYGKIPLMITAGCVNNTFNGCDKLQKDISLKDRLGINFNVINCCNHCYNIIYNNVPLSLLGVREKVIKIPTGNYRINLTTENGNEINNILEKCIKVFYYNESSFEIDEFTRGHFNRGVE